MANERNIIKEIKKRSLSTNTKALKMVRVPVEWVTIETNSLIEVLSLTKLVTVITKPFKTKMIMMIMIKKFQQVEK